MDVPQGAKFVFFIVPIFIICIVVILTLFSKNSQTPIGRPEEDIFGSDSDEGIDFDKFEVEVVEEGDGKEADPGDEVSVHYTGKLKDGTKFDSSYDRGQPFSFVLGIGEVIEGWDQGIVGMKVGEKRILKIPSDLGYGEGGSGIIPPNAGLVFETELVSIN